MMNAKEVYEYRKEHLDTHWLKDAQTKVSIAIEEAVKEDNDGFFMALVTLKGANTRRREMIENWVKGHGFEAEWKFIGDSLMIKLPDDIDCGDTK